jgi:hypothetical protein
VLKPEVNTEKFISKYLKNNETVLHGEILRARDKGESRHNTCEEEH